MIDFRYHIVSIAAVFLALALGLVLGSTSGFQNNAIGDLDKQISSLRKGNNDLRGTVDKERSLLKKSDALITTLLPSLIDNTLDGEQVVVISAPGASGSLRDAAEQTITQTGATVTGEVSLDDSMFATDSAAVLSGLVDRLSPSTPADGPALERAATAIADALLVDEKSRAGAQLSSGGTALLAGFQEAKLLKASDPLLRADLVVLVAASPKDTADPRLPGLLTFAGTLDKHDRGTVVVGDEPAGSPSNGLVHALRNDGNVSGFVSTVDDGATAGGRLRLARALDLERQGVAGHYGTGDGARAVIATPTPSP